MLGVDDGCFEGREVGIDVGELLGASVGELDGSDDGCELGIDVGDELGSIEG